MRRRLHNLVVLGFSVLLFLIVPFKLPAQTLMTPPPDGGKLTNATSFVQVGDNYEFQFSSPNVEMKWGHSPEGAIKKRALGEVLIYRKMAIEFLLLAREKMKYLGVALGMEEKPEIISPYRLKTALALTFERSSFPQMYGAFIYGAVYSGVIQRLDDPGMIRSFAHKMLRDAVQAVQKDAMIAHAQETKADAAKAGVKLEEEYRKFCEAQRDTIETSQPLTPSNSSTPEERLRAEQNDRLVQFLSASEIMGERLLYTPMKYSEHFSQRNHMGVNELEIYRDVSSIRKHPGSGWMFPEVDGTLANVILTYALADLKGQGRFDWRKMTKNLPRTELLCKDLEDEIPWDEVSSNAWGPIEVAIRDAIVQALLMNEKALLYLIQLDNRDFFEGTGWEKRWDKGEVEPNDPEIMLRKFLDLVPFFQNCEREMGVVRQRYPMPRENPEWLHKILLKAYERKQEATRLRQRNFIYAYTIMGYAFTRAIKWDSRLVYIFLSISDAYILSMVVWPERKYQADLRYLVESLFLNVNADWHYALTPESIRDVIIVDRERGRDLFWTAAISMGAGVWPVYRIFRAWQGRLRTGEAVFLTDQIYRLQVDLMKAMKMIEEKFPALWKDLEASEKSGLWLTNTYYKKIRGRPPRWRYFDDRSLPTAFPEVYDELQSYGFSLGMDPKEMSALIREINDQKGLAIPLFAHETENPLWKIANYMDLVEDPLKSSHYMQRIEETPKFDQAREARSLLQNTLETRLRNLPPAIEAEKRKIEILTNRNSNVGEIGQSANLRKIELDTELRHMTAMTKVYEQVSKRLQALPYNEVKDPEVRKMVRRFLWLRRQWLQLRNFVGRPAPEMQKVVPIHVVRGTVAEEVLGTKMKEAGLQKIWGKFVRTWKEEEEYKWGDKKLNDFYANLSLKSGKDWGIGERTFSKWMSQGLLQSVTITPFADRFSRAVFDGNLIHNFNGTLLNVTTTFFGSTIKVPLASMNISFATLRRASMATEFATNTFITIPFQIFRLHMDDESDLPWGEAFQAVFDRDCLFSILMRSNYTVVFHASYGPWRLKNVMKSRAAFKHRALGGMRSGGMSTAGAHWVNVINFVDKFALGGIAWTKTSELFHSGGRCNPVRDPFKDIVKVAFTDANDPNGVTAKLEEETGIRFVSSPEEFEKWEEEESREDRLPTLPPVRRETEMDRIRRELELGRPNG